MLESFIDWFLNIEWTSWDALAAIGQVVGAGATVWAVRVA